MPAKKRADAHNLSPEKRALQYAEGIRASNLRTPIVPDATFFPFLFSPPQ